MNYLILNEKLENGVKIDLEKYSKNIVESLGPKDLLYAELTYQDEVKETAHFYGDISIELIKSPALELYVSKYVYEIGYNEDNELIVIDAISDERYINLLFDLFDLNINTTYKKEWILIEALSYIDINKIDLVNLIKRIEKIFDDNMYIEGPFVKLLKLLNKNILDSNKKKKVIDSLYNYLENNCNKIEPLLLDRDEERYLFANIKEETYPKLYSILDKSLNATIEEDYLPF